MARGITETDVHQAADALVSAGERPTIDRIRAYLGTGSPNTVLRWLDTWWAKLDARLQAGQTRLELPQVPGSVAGTFQALWEQALASAQDLQLQALAGQHHQLATERAALQASAGELTEASAAFQRDLAAAQQAQRLAETQAAELQHRVQQLTAQLEDLTAQRDTYQASTQVQTLATQAAQDELRNLRAAFELEREVQTRRTQVLEDRAHQATDDARQELREARKALHAAQQGRTKAETALQEEREQWSNQHTRLRVELAEAQTQLKVLPRLKQPTAARRRSSAAPAGKVTTKRQSKTG